MPKRKGMILAEGSWARLLPAAQVLFSGVNLRFVTCERSIFLKVSNRHSTVDRELLAPVACAWSEEVADERGKGSEFSSQDSSIYKPLLDHRQCLNTFKSSHGLKFTIPEGIDFQQKRICIGQSGIFIVPRSENSHDQHLKCLLHEMIH